MTDDSYREKQHKLYVCARTGRHGYLRAIALDALWRAASEADMLAPREHSHTELTPAADPLGVGIAPLAPGQPWTLGYDSLKHHRRNTMITATKIYVTTRPLNQEYENPKSHTFTVYQFSNGSIMVPGQGKPNQFFNTISDDGEEFKPDGPDGPDTLSIPYYDYDAGDVVDVWVRSKDTQDFTEDDLRDLVEQSIAYYAYYGANGTTKILELLSSPISN